MYLEAGKPELSVNRLARKLALNPNNHALTMSYATALTRAGHPAEAARILEAHSRLYPNDPLVWYELAETQGLAGNIPAVHRARTEYFILNGAFNQAERQLGYALDLAEGDFHTTESIHARLGEIREMREDIDI